MRFYLEYWSNGVMEILNYYGMQTNCSTPKLHYSITPSMLGWQRTDRTTKTVFDAMT